MIRRYKVGLRKKIEIPKVEEAEACETNITGAVWTWYNDDGIPQTGTDTATLYTEFSFDPFLRVVPIIPSPGVESEYKWRLYGTLTGEMCCCVPTWELTSKPVAASDDVMGTLFTVTPRGDLAVGPQLHTYSGTGWDRTGVENGTYVFTATCNEQTATLTIEIEDVSNYPP